MATSALTSREDIHTAEDRFRTKVQKTESCWLWQGWKLPKGYGGFWYARRDGYAHRFSWELHVGAIPDGLFVLHDCDTPPCVRPDHLFLGTQADNLADMDRKGRRRTTPRFGADNPNCKLTPARVEQILQQLHRGDRQVDIAADHGVSQTLVSMIKRGVAWAA